MRKLSKMSIIEKNLKWLTHQKISLRNKVSSIYSEKKVVIVEPLIITTENRGKKKHITILSNLEIYNLPIKEVSKKLSKKFACSASVVKDTIEMQGD